MTQVPEQNLGPEQTQPVSGLGDPPAEVAGAVPVVDQPVVDQPAVDAPVIDEVAPVAGPPAPDVPVVDVPPEVAPIVDPTVTAPDTSVPVGDGTTPEVNQSTTDGSVTTPVDVPVVDPEPVVVAQAPVDSGTGVVDSAPLSGAGVGDPPAPEVIAPEVMPVDAAPNEQQPEEVPTMPEPGQITDAGSATQGPQPAADEPVVDEPGAIPSEVTADGVTQLIPSVPDAPTDQPIEKPITDEEVQAARDLMPPDVEQVIRAIAKEAALEAIGETVVAESIITIGLAEPGTPSS